MIYLLPPDTYPKKGEYTEESIHIDYNEFEWHIRTVQNGFFVRYFGDKYFLEKTYYCEVEEEGEVIAIPNTNTIFIQGGFDVFCMIRDLIKEHCTDAIQATFQDMLTERLKLDRGRLASEFVN